MHCAEHFLLTIRKCSLLRKSIHCTVSLSTKSYKYYTDGWTMCNQALNGKCPQLHFIWQLIFSPAWRICCLFVPRTFSYSSCGKAWYLKDTAKQSRNLHVHTQSNNKTHSSSSKYKALDTLALQTSYKSNTCSIENDIFFLLSHSKAPNY